MILYDYWRSSSAWRVRTALHWKGVSFERRVVSLVKDGGEQHREEFQTLNPSRQLPVLVLDDGVHALTQSMAIIAYLEERFPTPPLLPAWPTPRRRERTRSPSVPPTRARDGDVGWCQSRHSSPRKSCRT